MVCGKSNLNPSGRVTDARLTSFEGGVEALGFSGLLYLFGRPSRECLGLFSQWMCGPLWRFSRGRGGLGRAGSQVFGFGVQRREVVSSL